MYEGNLIHFAFADRTRESESGLFLPQTSLQFQANIWRISSTGFPVEKKMVPARLGAGEVMQVVKEQIMRALTTKPSSLDQFKSKLQNLSYAEILKIRQSERMNQEDFQSRPILELKEKIQPEILELIKQQRLNRLVEGTCFRKLNSRRRQDKFWYCRLSPNHKVFHYGDLEESPQGEVPHDSLQDKL
ncbi:UNVERIFIED_CONTAM: Engulfment and cell motility protein 1 [Gekko kuhli]